MSRTNSSSSNLGTELTEKSLSKQRLRHEKQKSAMANNSLFKFSFSQSTAENTADDHRVSKFESARVNAPFVMGTSMSQSISTVCITKTGEQTTKSVTKHELAKQIGIHIRDLRIVEKSPGNRVEAAINPRANVIILSIENMKLVVSSEQVIIFCPDEPISEKFIAALQQNIQQQVEANGPLVDEYTGEAVEGTENDDQCKKVRFEHLVLETVLSVACSDINENLIDSQDDLAIVFNAFQEDQHVHASVLSPEKIQQEREKFDVKLKKNNAKKSARMIKDMIRKSEMSPIKTKLQKLRKKASEIARVLLILLEEEELFSRLFLKNSSFGHEKSSFESTFRSSFGANNTSPKYMISTDREFPAAHTHSTAHLAIPSTNTNSAKRMNRRGSVTTNAPGRRGSVMQSIFMPVKGRGMEEMEEDSNPLHLALSYDSAVNNMFGRDNAVEMVSHLDNNNSINSTINTSSDKAPNTAEPMAPLQQPSHTDTLKSSTTVTPHQHQVHVQQQIVSCEEIQNLELILDNFISQFNWISSEIDDLMDQLTNAEVNAALQLDIIRNRIMRYTVYLSMLSIALAFPAVISGIFGMNLQFPSHLYKTESPFLITVSMLAIGVPTIFIILFRIGTTRGIF